MIWFIGVVEDINDPLERGRMRVRCFGYHSESTQDVPTDALPWASPMMPITSASISGVGQSPTGIKQGTWVVGFFRDGEYAQDPIIMGTLPSYSTAPNKTIGFRDPTGTYPKAIGNDLPDSAKASTYSQSWVDAARSTAQSTANHISIPDIADPIYPNNQVNESESGITIEIDDTNGKTRYGVTHNSGTYDEMQHNGDHVKVIQGNDYTLIAGDDFVEVQGDVIVYANGQTVNVNADQFIFNSGSYNELIRIDDLTTKLNLLITEFNAFTLVFNSHIHTVEHNGTHASTTPLSAVETPIIAVDATAFSKTDYNNPDITHGPGV